MFLKHKNSDDLTNDIQNACNEINNERKKSGILSKIANLFNANFMINNIYNHTNSSEESEIEKDIKNHLERIGKISHDYNEIIEKHSHDVIHKKDAIVTLKEVLFCLKMMDISIINVKTTASVVANSKIANFSIFDKLIEFIELFILNFMKSQYDISLKIKQMDILNIILDISNFFKAQLKDKDIQLYVNGLVDNDTIIVGDYFYLFYSMLHIISYILCNLYTKKENAGKFERKIIFNISNEEHHEKPNYKNIKIDIFVTNEIERASINTEDIFDEKHCKKCGLSICKKIILTHNGSVQYKYNRITDTYHFIIIIPFLNEGDDQHIQNLSRKTIEKVLLLNYESRCSSKSSTIRDIHRTGEVKNLAIQSAPGSRTNSRNNSFVISKNKDGEDSFPFELNKRILEYTKNIHSKSSSILHVATTKILIVDDSKLNQKFLVHLLSMFFKDDNLYLVENGMEALNEINDNVYNIIFMDNNMPFLKGSFVIKLLRNLHFKGMIIGLTGDDMDPSDNEMLYNGANMVFKKPIKMDEIKNIYEFYSRNYSLDDYTGIKLVKKEDGKLYIS